MLVSNIISPQGDLPDIEPKLIILSQINPLYNKWNFLLGGGNVSFVNSNQASVINFSPASFFFPSTNPAG
jgi:hypothetical protein